MKPRLLSLGLCVIGAGAALVSTSTLGGSRAAAVVALAGVGALLATKGWLRRVVAMAMTVVGLWMILGDTVVAVFAGIVVAAGGALAVATSAAWPVMGARYDRASKPDDGDLWAAIDRGEDPTAPAAGQGGDPAARKAELGGDPAARQPEHGDDPTAPRREQER